MDTFRNVTTFGTLRLPGLLLEWRNIDGVWDGRVVHAVQEHDGWPLVEEWLPAGLLDPVRSDRTRESHGILLGAA